jgi:NADPH:quinone reductase-like Zn-dependent oxidoreductase
MRAIVQDTYGTPDVLELRAIDRPPITSKQVLIEVHAAGIDRGVAHIMSGTPYLIRLAGYGVTKPKHPVLGADVAGRMIAVGDDVTGVCSTRKVDMVRSIGADDVIDYTAHDFLDGTTRYDLIIDIGGRDAVRRLRRALTRTGTLVITGCEAGSRRHPRPRRRTDQRQGGGRRSTRVTDGPSWTVVFGFR